MYILKGLINFVKNIMNFFPILWASVHGVLETVASLYFHFLILYVTLSTDSVT